MRGEGELRVAISKGPLAVSTAGLVIAAPLAMNECTRVLSRLDREVQKTPCPFTFPQHEKKETELQNPTNKV